MQKKKICTCTQLKSVGHNIQKNAKGAHHTRGAPLHLSVVEVLRHGVQDELGCWRCDNVAVHALGVDCDARQNLARQTTDLAVLATRS